MTSDRPALHVSEETQSSGLNMLDILGDKRALAIGALTAIGVAGVMHQLKPEILQSVATEATDLFKSLNGTLKSHELGGMSGGATMLERDMMFPLSLPRPGRFEWLSSENHMDMFTRRDLGDLTVSDHPGKTSWASTPGGRHYFG